MVAKVKCGTHGEQDRTFVCIHIIETLKDGEPRGFYWNNPDGEFQAICAACNDLSEEEFYARESELISILCFECFADAAAINGVDLG